MFQEILSRLAATLDKHELPYMIIKDIVIHKIFAGRPRDLEDVRGIILKNPDLDKTYIEKWLREFDAVSESKDFLKTFQSIH